MSGTGNSVPRDEPWRTLELGDLLAQGAEALGVEVSSSVLEAFLIYLRLLGEWGAKMNLTSIRDPHEAVIRHFLDSLTLVPLLPEGAFSLVDVGTGAGFPGLVLKLLRPEIELVLLDSVGKRINFLDAVIAEFDLEDVWTHRARAEEAGWDPELRERFDVVTARAVAEMRVLAEYCVPLACRGGLFLAMKGPLADEEFPAAGKALERLGGHVEEVVFLALPFVDEPRRIGVVRKHGRTPDRYPRRSAEITKNPL